MKTLWFFLFTVLLICPHSWGQIASTWDGPFLRYHDTVTDETIDVLAQNKLFDEFHDSVGFINAATRVWTFTRASGGSLLTSATTNGVATFTSDAADDSAGHIASDLVWQQGKYCNMEARVKIRNPTSGFNVGWSDAQSEALGGMAVNFSGVVAGASASDAAVFVHDPDATTDLIRVVSVKNGTTSTTATTLNTFSNVWRIYRVSLDPSGNADFWVDGDHITQKALGVTATTSMCAYISGISRAAGNTYVDIDYIRVWSQR